MSNWTLNSQRIYVTELSGAVKQIIPALQPLGGGTVYQTFGYETLKSKISAVVVGEANKESIKDLTATGASYALVSPEGSLGNFFVASVDFKRSGAIRQSIDVTGGLTCESPVFTLEIELLQDLS